MIAPCQAGVAYQVVGLLQQTHHHPHGIPQQAAVAWFVQECRGDRAVYTHDTGLQLRLPGARQ